MLLMPCIALISLAIGLGMHRALCVLHRVHLLDRLSHVSRSDLWWLRLAGWLDPYANRWSAFAWCQRLRMWIQEHLQRAGYEDAPVMGVLLEGLVVIVVGALGGAICFRPVWCGAVLGMLGTGLWLLCRVYRLQQQRRESLQLRLPFVLDALQLMVEAGLDLVQALTRIAERERTGSLAQELKRFQRELCTGMSRRSALAGFGRRIGLEVIDELILLLMQAERMGTPVAPLLSDCARRLREERLMQAERKGVAATQKLLLPLICCILPATFLVIFGPLAVRWVVSGGDVLG